MAHLLSLTTGSSFCHLGHVPGVGLDCNWGGGGGLWPKNVIERDEE